MHFTGLYKINTIFMFSIFVMLSVAVVGQEKPYREYNPEEYISLDRNLGLDNALAIINGFSTKYENKIIQIASSAVNETPTAAATTAATARAAVSADTFSAVVNNTTYDFNAHVIGKIALIAF